MILDKAHTSHIVLETNGDRTWFDPKRDVPESSRNGLSWVKHMYILTDKFLDDGFNMDIAGTDAEGNDATNDISRLVIKAVKELGTIASKPVLKYSEKTDRDLLRQCYETIQMGRGLPSIAFDENCKRALRSIKDFDYTEEDIANVNHIGCIELSVPGRSYTDPMNAFFNLPKILLVTMNNGWINGKRVGLELPAAETFGQLRNNYFKQLAYFIKMYAEAMNDAAQFFNQYYARPMVSSLVDGCIEKALLIDEGGARYFSKSMNCCGIADFADSMIAIKKLVYDGKELGLDEFYEILESDFEGKEDLRQRLVNRCQSTATGYGRWTCSQRSWWTLLPYCEGM
jgi:formate C-acetyltransferase